MKKTSYIVWVILIFLLFTVLLIIGFNYKKNYKYIKAKEKIVDATEKYLEDSILIPNENITLQINIDDLVKDKYLKKVEIDNKECNGTVKIEQKKNKYVYTTNLKCE